MKHIAMRLYHETFNLQDAKTLSTPLDMHHRTRSCSLPLHCTSNRSYEKVPHREAIGSLMYTALGAKPDVMFAVTLLSQFMQLHWEEVKRIFRYLKGTIKRKLVIGTKARGRGIGKYVESRNDSDSRDVPTQIEPPYTFVIPYLNTSSPLTEARFPGAQKKQPIVALSTTRNILLLGMQQKKPCVYSPRNSAVTHSSSNVSLR